MKRKRSKEEIDQLLVAGILLSGFVALMAYGVMQGTQRS